LRDIGQMNKKNRGLKVYRLLALGEMKACKEGGSSCRGLKVLKPGVEVIQAHRH